MARRTLPVVCMTSWAAPHTGGYDVELPAGEELTIAHDPAAGATAVTCDPIRYGALHARFVPWTDRWRFLKKGGREPGASTP